MKIERHTLIRLIALLVVPVLFHCSAGFIGINRTPSAAEDSHKLPILKGPADYFNIGHEFFCDGQSRIALHYLQKALELAPFDAKYRLFTGLAKNDVYGFETAEPDIDMALTIRQELVGYEGIIRDYYTRYGVYCLNTGKMEKAISCFNKLILLLPDDEEAREYLAAAYLDLARTCSSDKTCSFQRTDALYGKVFTILRD